MQSVMCGYSLESVILCVIAYDVDVHVLIFTQLRYSHDKCPGTWYFVRNEVGDVYIC